MFSLLSPVLVYPDCIACIKRLVLFAKLNWLALGEIFTLWFKPPPYKALI